MAFYPFKPGCDDHTILKSISFDVASIEATGDFSVLCVLHRDYEYDVMMQHTICSNDS